MHTTSHFTTHIRINSHTNTLCTHKHTTHTQYRHTSTYMHTHTINMYIHIIHILYTCTTHTRTHTVYICILTSFYLISRVVYYKCIVLPLSILFAKDSVIVVINYVICNSIMV